MSSKKLISAACRKGHLSQLRRDLEDTELDVRSEPLGSEGETALHVACAHGHLDIVQYLVNDRGCSVTVTNSRAVGATPLVVAWANKHWEVVEFLLNAIQDKGLVSEAGLVPTVAIQLQEVVKFGDDAFHHACMNGYLEVVKFLTCSGLINGITAVSFHGTTPLQVAWENKHWEVASCLLQTMREHCRYISDLSLTSVTQLQEMVGFREDAFHVACSRGNLEVVQYLHEYLKCSLIQCNTQGETPIDMARLNGQLYVIHFLLESGKCSAPDMTELHVACMRADEERVRNICRDITSLSTPDKYGITAIHYATSQSENLCILVSIAEQRNMFSLLVRQDGRGNTPLHYAARCGYTKSVKMLVSYYKSVNMQNSDGDTPLHLSIKSSHYHSNVVKEIIQHKSCNPSIVNAQNETPLHIASQYGELERAELLLVIGKYSPEDIRVAIEDKFLLHQAVACNRCKFVQALLKVPGCNINQFSSDGETHLHVACRHTFEVFQLLTADNKCDINAQNRNGLTALHITIASFDLEKYCLLTTNMDCNPNIFCSEGSAPLHMMVEKKKNFGQSFTLLLKHPKCNPNIKNEEGYSALHLAVRRQSLFYVTSLLLQDKVDPNIQNHTGNTPLHEVVNTRAPIVILDSIIQHRTCNPCLRNGSGKTPLQIASENRLVQYFITLVASGKYSHEEVWDAACEFRYLLHQTVLLNDVIQLKMLHSFVQHDVNEANEEGETPLHIACRQCSIEVLQTLVADKRCELNVPNTNGETALHIAVYNVLDSTQKVEFLLNCSRCDPNITNNERCTPLHVAIKGRRFRNAATLLMNFKLNPNAQDNYGNTPLHMSIRNRSLSSVKSLLHRESIDVNIQNKEGNTPLHEAVRRKVPVNVVEALTLHKSCNPSIANNAGKTPLKVSSADFRKIHYSAVLATSGKCTHEDIVKATEGTLLLHQAVSASRLKLVLRLIAMQECNINETNSNGDTPLHVACRTWNSKSIVKNLVKDSRCDLNAQDRHGNTALHLAAGSTSESTENVQCIIQSDRCDPNISNSEGHTPLHIAVRRTEYKHSAVSLNHSKCKPNIQDLSGNVSLTSYMSISNVQLFLNHKDIDLNIQNGEGNTPLHEAVMRHFPVDIVKALTLHKSCNPSVANNAGMTPLQISVTYGRCDYVQVLIASEKCSHKDIMWVTEGTLFHQAVSLNDTLHILGISCIPNYNVNITNSAGETVLHVACRTNYNKVILKKLVEDSRCDLNVQDHHGNTALHLAIYSGTEVVEKVQCILQSERCNPNITNSQGYTPLHIAVRRKKFGVPVIVVKAVLLHSNCNPSIANSEGMTPLQMAVGSQEMEIATALVTSRKCSHEDIVWANKDASLLIHAVFSDNVELLTALFNAGVDIIKFNFKGNTALHITCRTNCNTVILKKLIEDSRCDLNVQDHPLTCCYI